MTGQPPHSGSRTQRFHAALESLKTHTILFEPVAAILIGACCGLAAVGFRALIIGLTHLFWQNDSHRAFLLGSVPAWQIVAVPTLAGLVVGPIVYYFSRESRGHGVPEVMAAVSLHNGIIRARTAIAKTFASALTLASGGSAGREGPIIQIGAAIGSNIGQLLRVSNERLQTFVSCGAAAGIAATFNAPIAGALFSMEVIMRQVAVARFAPVVISSVLATVISQKVYGNHAVFEIPGDLGIQSAWDLLAYLVLGLFCGVIAAGFTTSLGVAEAIADRVPRRLQMLSPAIGGFLLGLTALWLPQILGDGHTTIDLSLAAAFSLPFLALLLVAKILATCFTLGSGGSGGVFAPSLTIGAIAGALIAQAVNLTAGGMLVPVSAFALVGMAGLVAGTTHAPIAAILIIAEITQEYGLILPLMLVCITSILIAQLLQRESIYTMKLARRGLDIFSTRPLDILRDHTIGDYLEPKPETVPPTLRLRQLFEQMVSSRATQFYVVDENRTYLGVVLLADLRQLLLNPDGLDEFLLAEDAAADTLPLCYPDENLSQAFQKFEQSGGYSELPVLDRETRQLVGVIHDLKVLSKYNEEMRHLETSSSLANLVGTSLRRNKVRVIDGFSIADWEAPSFLVGKALSETGIASHYHLHVILIKKEGPGGIRDNIRPTIPDGKYIIEENDVLSVYGRDEDIDRAKSL